MPNPLECHSCSREREFDRLEVRERIAHDGRRRLAHAIGSALPRWLIPLPRRHVDEAVAVLSRLARNIPPAA